LLARVNVLEHCSCSVLASRCCEKLIAEAREPLGNPDEGERPAFEAVTRKLVKTQLAEKTTVFVLANCKECELAQTL
jgi:hypothetical protein